MKFPTWCRFRLRSCDVCKLTDSSHSAVNDEHHTKWGGNKNKTYSASTVALKNMT